MTYANIATYPSVDSFFSALLGLSEFKKEMNTTQLEALREHTFLWRALLYAVHPDEARPMSLDEAPDYVARIVPIFFVIMMFEVT